MFMLDKNLGRFGDSELRFVDGELSHVNPTEAHAIDMYGSEGEKLVKAAGSGTINPDTGLKEYWWQAALLSAAPYIPAAVAVGSWALGSLSESSAGATSEKQADIQSDHLQDLKINYQQQKADAFDVKTASEEMLSSDFVESRYDISDKTISTLESVGTSLDKQVTKSDLVYGTANKRGEDFREDLTRKIEGAESNLWQNYKQKISDVDLQYETTIADLDAKIDAADYEQALADNKSEQWYPWKYSSKFLQSIVPGGEPGWTTQV